MPIVLASAKRPYSETMAPIPGKPREAKKMPRYRRSTGCGFPRSTRAPAKGYLSTREAGFALACLHRVRDPAHGHARDQPSDPQDSIQRQSPPVLSFVGYRRREGAIDFHADNPQEIPQLGWDPGRSLVESRRRTSSRPRLTQATCFFSSRVSSCRNRTRIQSDQKNSLLSLRVPIAPRRARQTRQGRGLINAQLDCWAAELVAGGVSAEPAWSICVRPKMIDGCRHHGGIAAHHAEPRHRRGGDATHRRDI